NEASSSRTVRRSLDGQADGMAETADPVVLIIRTRAAVIDENRMGWARSAGLTEWHCAAATAAGGHRARVRGGVLAGSVAARALDGRRRGHFSKLCAQRARRSRASLWRRGAGRGI